MSVKVSTIRARVATAIEAIAGETFKESLFPFPMFGKTQQTVANLGFAVGVDTSQALSGRQRPSEGIEATLNLQVVFAARLRPLQQIIDYDTFLDKEQLIITAILNRGDATLYNDISIRYDSSDRTIVPSGEYFLSTLNFSVYHYIPLS